MKIDWEFSRALRDTRLRCALSQQGLARLAGIDHSYVSRLESGHREPTRDAIYRMAKAMELRPGETDGLLIAAGFVPRDIANEVWEFCARYRKEHRRAVYRREELA